MLTLYFSGTGNTRFIAELFSRNMNAECHSIEENIDFGEMIDHNDILIFCYPIYGSSVPSYKWSRHHKIYIFCTTENGQGIPEYQPGNRKKTWFSQTFHAAWQKPECFLAQT